MYVTIQTSRDTVSHKLILSLLEQKIIHKWVAKSEVITFDNLEREMYEWMLWSETLDTERYQTLLLSHIM